MYSELFSLARTQDEVDLLRQELKLLSDSLFQRQGAFEEVLTKKIRAKTANVVRKIFASAEINNKEKFFEEIIGSFGQLKQLELIVAFEPREETVERIWEWVAKNMGAGIVLNIRVDPGIGAGTILDYQGVYRNYSLKKLLESVFESQSQTFIKILAQ